MSRSRIRKAVTDPHGMGFKRPPLNCFSVTFDDKRVPQTLFAEDAALSMHDIMESMKKTNAKAGRKLTYALSKDGKSARWRMAYTNVKRITSGKVKCFTKRRT